MASRRAVHRQSATIFATPRALRPSGPRCDSEPRPARPLISPLRPATPECAPRRRDPPHPLRDRGRRRAASLPGRRTPREWRRRNQGVRRAPGFVLARWPISTDHRRRPDRRIAPRPSCENAPVPLLRRAPRAPWILLPASISRGRRAIPWRLVNAIVKTSTSLGPSPRNVAIASRTSRALPIMWPKGASMAVINASVCTPLRPVVTIDSASASRRHASS